MRSSTTLHLISVSTVSAFGAICLGLMTACADDAGSPAPVTPPVAEVRLPGNPLTDPMGDAEANAEPSPSRFPEIAFVDVSAGLPRSGTWLGYPLLYDFNNDKLADLVASNREEDGFSVWEAVKGGGWTLRNEGLERDMGYGPARSADVNSDGIPDLLVSAHTDALRVYLNDGQMKWTRSTSPIENAYLLLDIAAGHLNTDTFPDVLGVGHFKGGLSVYTGDGKGGFARRPESRVLLHEMTFGKVVDLKDLDQDGRDDVFATTNEGAKVYLTRGEDTLQWEDISTNLPNPKIGNSLQALAVASFTGKAQPEVAICMVLDPGDPPGRRNNIGVYAWRAAEKRWEQIDQGLDRDESYRDVKAADMNNDGKPDLVVMSRESGAVVYLGDGTGKFTPKGRLPGLRSRGRIALGDIDGDGRTDVAITSAANKNTPGGGGVFAFLNRPEIWQ